MKLLTAFFSAEGTTARMAKALAEAVGSDLFEIRPADPYTAADLKWTNPMARCNREKIGKKDVPVEGKVEGFGQYDTVLLGFPIWYYSAPNVVGTFCRQYGWEGKKLIIFATSGGSDIGKTAEKLGPSVKGADILGAKVFNDPSELTAWAKSLLDAAKPRQ